ncbi:hypothetical protein Tco_0807866 [Tanacetum coccineum]
MYRYLHYFIKYQVREVGIVDTHTQLSRGNVEIANELDKQHCLTTIYQKPFSKKKDIKISDLMNARYEKQSTGNAKEQEGVSSWLVEVSLFDGVFDGAFGGVVDEEVVVGEGMVVTSSSLEMLINSCLGGIMVSLLFLEGLEEEALVEFMVE